MRHLDFDSEFFGRKIVQVDFPTEHVPADTDMVCLLADCDNTPSIQRAEKSGFALVDIRVTLERTTAPFGSSARLWKDTDLEVLVGIARESHRITRFYSDETLPNKRCDDLYEAWIRNSCEGWADRVLVVGHPSGYVTVHLNDDITSSIGLIAVSAGARGQGFGHELVQGALDFAHSRGRDKMTVVTQGRNIAAQRLFQSCGFRTSKTELWYQSWR